MNLITFNQLLSAVGGRGKGLDQNQIAFHSISIDSRTVQPGEIFWAIQGEHYDGHQFIEDAIHRGAVAVVVDENFDSEIAVPSITVKETTEGLKCFARWYRQTVEPFVIGITGSVGKTTTRSMISTMLSEQFCTTESPRNYNNHIGLPLSLLNIQPQHEIAVIELGASHVGEIEELAEIAAPQFGIVTKIGEAHLNTFGNQQKIQKSKGELVSALPQTGVAILNGDDPLVRSLAENTDSSVLFVGEGDDNHVQATHVHVEWNHLSFRVDSLRYHLNVVGRHHLTSALCAVAVGRELGMSAEAIQEGFDQFKAVSGRSQLQQVGTWNVVDDTYNANPTSMDAACEMMSTWQGQGKGLMLVGDMLELGTESNRYHYELGNRIARSNIDHLLAYGTQSHRVISGARQSGINRDSVQQCDCMESMLKALDDLLEPDDLIVVKGSRGMKMERVIDWLRTQTDQNEISNNDATTHVASLK